MLSKILVFVSPKLMILSKMFPKMQFFSVHVFSGLRLYISKPKYCSYFNIFLCYVNINTNVFRVVGPTQEVADGEGQGVADGEGQLLTLFGSHSEQGIKSYGQKKIAASTRRVTL